MDADVALVGLVDGRGWLLLQERDDRAPVDPDRWSLPGGGVEVGESAAEAAHAEDVFAVFTGRTDATDANVVCTEGRQIVFVDPARVPGLDLTDATRAIFPQVFAAHPR